MTATGVGRREFGDEESPGGSEHTAQDEGQREGFETTFGRVNGHGDNCVHDGCSSENDGHDRSCGGTFEDGGGSAESEDERERTEGPCGASDEAPGDAAASEAPVRPTQFQHGSCRDADQGISDADEEKGLQAGVRCLSAHGHEAAAFVKEDTIDAPGQDGEEGKDNPVHISHGRGG